MTAIREPDGHDDHEQQQPSEVEIVFRMVGDGWTLDASIGSFRGPQALGEPSAALLSFGHFAACANLCPRPLLKAWRLLFFRHAGIM